MLGAAMNRSETNASGDRAWTETEGKPDAEPAGQRPQSVLTRGERWLACATAAAVLLSGLNALLQVWKALLEYCVRHG